MRLSVFTLFAVTVISCGRIGFDIETDICDGCSWYDSAWSYRRVITIHGANVAGTLVDFPVLVSISDPGWVGKPQANGDDFRFTSSDGATLISHEVERWEATTGVLVAWVKVPMLASGRDTEIVMYYGNPVVGASASGAGVWTNDFRAVWHLNQDPGLLSMVDSTGNGNAGVPEPAMTAANRVDAQIGQGIMFNGMGDYLNMGADASIGSVHPVTYEIWFRMLDGVDADADAWGNSDFPRLFHKTLSGQETYPLSIFLSRATNYNAPMMLRGYFTTAVIIRREDNTVTPGAWHHFAAVISLQTPGLQPKNPRIFIDGMDAVDYDPPRQYSTYQEGSGDLRDDTAFELFLGDRSERDRSFEGILDECRLSGVDRSNEWVKTSYRTQASPSTFMTVGLEERVP